MPVVDAPTPEETPGIAIELVRPSPEGANVRPGVNLATSSMDLTPCSSIFSCENAVMLTGTLSIDSWRRVAVTTISSRSGAAAPEAGLGVSASPAAGNVLAKARYGSSVLQRVRRAGRVNLLLTGLR